MNSEKVSDALDAYINYLDEFESDHFVFDSASNATAYNNEPPTTSSDNCKQSCESTGGRRLFCYYNVTEEDSNNVSVF